MKPWVFRFMSLWPPYLGAGVRVKKVAPDFLSIEVEMKLRFWNQNWVGTHFGGSLYAMTDPFYMLMLFENLGRAYIVWDKAASIRFKKPGRGRVRATFVITAEQLAKIRLEADENGRSEPEFEVPIIDEAGDVVALVQKKVYVRRKEKSPA